jgi:hypothetical protein
VTLAARHRLADGHKFSEGWSGRSVTANRRR